MQPPGFIQWQPRPNKLHYTWYGPAPLHQTTSTHPPNASPPPAQVREVLDTMRTAARLGSSSLAAYVISMSQAASDVLAVELLQKEARLMVRGDLVLGGGAWSWLGVDGPGAHPQHNRHTRQP
jgi:hypothetical protein